jgi:excinuclease UvrABC ATPase subunit
MFGTTKCGKCESATFKVQEISPKDAAYKMYAVQCVSCQTPIGITDYYNSGVLLKQQEKTIADLSQKIVHIEQAVNQIVYALQSRGR